jgi:hypothetical protein
VETARPRYGCIGALLAVAGFFGGGMIGVAIGWFVTKATGCTPPEGFPICDIYRYWVPGMLIGMLTLPGIVIWRLRRAAATAHTERS